MRRTASLLFVAMVMVPHTRGGTRVKSQKDDSCAGGLTIFNANFMLSGMYLLWVEVYGDLL